jgi:hypothetical protein
MHKARDRAGLLRGAAGQQHGGSPTPLVLKRSLGNTNQWSPPQRRGPVPEGRSANET